MRRGIVVAVVAVVAAGAAGWCWRDAPWMVRGAQALGLRDAAPPTGRALAEAGVHKCRTGAAVVYSDQPCPRGSREVAADGGTVNVVGFPKPAPQATGAGLAASLAGGGIVQGMSSEERDRLRDKQVEDAMNRR